MWPQISSGCGQPTSQPTKNSWRAATKLSTELKPIPPTLSDKKNQVLEGYKFAHQAAVQGSLDGGSAVRLGLPGGRWQMYRDPPRPPPVGVTVGGNGGDALSSLSKHKHSCSSFWLKTIQTCCLKSQCRVNYVPQEGHLLAKDDTSWRYQ